MEYTEIVQQALKRFLDFTIATVLLIIFSVPLMLISIAIKMESKGPVIFMHERTGRDGKVFTLYKLRSMKILTEQSNAFHGEQNVTTVGKVLRRWRIDEIPQFINVLRGEMSVVGPRPTLPYQAKRYDPEQRRRLDVNPGLTGWSQIHGDSAISWPDRIVLDLWYVDNWSLWLDLKIMLLTPGALLRIRKINAEQAPLPDEISSLPQDKSAAEE